MAERPRVALLKDRIDVGLWNWRIRIGGILRNSSGGSHDRSSDYPWIETPPSGHDK